MKAIWILFVLVIGWTCLSTGIAGAAGHMGCTGHSKGKKSGHALITKSLRANSIAILSEECQKKDDGCACQNGGTCQGGYCVHDR